MNVDHGYFNDICGTALNGRVDGVSFGGTSNDGISGVDIFQIAATSQNGLHITMLSGKRDLLANIIAQSRISGVIGVNQIFGFRSG